MSEKYYDTLAKRDEVDKMQFLGGGGIHYNNALKLM